MNAKNCVSNLYIYIFGTRIDAMNAMKMEQDHPCVIDTIRRHYLNDPSPIEAPYQLDNPNSTLVDLSHGQIPVILELLQNKVTIR